MQWQQCHSQSRTTRKRTKECLCNRTAKEGGRRQTKGKSIWVLSVLQRSQIEGLKWRLDADAESQVTKKTESSNRWKREGGNKKERKREEETNNCTRTAKPSHSDCHPTIDLTKLRVPSQDPQSPLHLAKAGIRISAIIKLLTNSTYVSVSSSPWVLVCHWVINFDKLWQTFLLPPNHEKQDCGRGVNERRVSPLSLPSLPLPPYVRFPLLSEFLHPLSPNPPRPSIFIILPHPNNNTAGTQRKTRGPWPNESHAFTAVKWPVSITSCDTLALSLPHSLSPWQWHWAWESRGDGGEFGGPVGGDRADTSECSWTRERERVRSWGRGGWGRGGWGRGGEVCVSLWWGGHKSPCFQLPFSGARFSLPPLVFRKALLVPAYLKNHKHTRA